MSKVLVDTCIWSEVLRRKNPSQNKQNTPHKFNVKL